MNIRILFSVLLIIFSLESRSVAEDPVNFVDDDLKTAVEAKLGPDPTPTDMLGLIKLHSAFNDISDLTGLEYATNLQDLNLRGNILNSISPITGLTNLLYLNLSETGVSNLSPLSGMTQLKTLDIHNNGITNISALSNLTNLEELVLRENQLGGGVSGLSKLKNLETLNLESTGIYDIFSLVGLKKLKDLNLYNNLISGVNILSYLPDLEKLYLHRNQIVDISGLVDLTKLKKLSLEDNFLNQDAYCHSLQIIADNNPSAFLSYDYKNDPPTQVQAKVEPMGTIIHVTWNAVCNGPDFTSYYRVFRTQSLTDTKVPVSAWQTSTMLEDTSITPGAPYWYWVQTALSDQGWNAGDYSEPVIAEAVSNDPELTLSSTAGGTVTLPGEGVFSYAVGEIVPVEAVSIDTNLFDFVGWTGTAVEAGKVVDPGAALTIVTVDSQYTLKAQFLALSNTLIVDGATADPNNGKGTEEQPFDRIQQAIDVAGAGASIRVQPGTYEENLDLLGKDIQLIGMDPNSPDINSYPVIDGNDNGPVIRFAGEEGPECLLLGFTLTRGRPAIECHNSSPIVAYCLIVGNHATDPNGGAIELVNSQAMFFNCTIADNLGGAQGAGLLLNDSSILMTNSILWGNTPMEIQVNGIGVLIHSYSDIGQSPGLQNGVGRINVDPMFVESGLWSAVGPNDPNLAWIEGDYHLKSQTGRWDAVLQTWLVDTADSPCIDTGDPLSPIGLEPIPNGGIVNMGAYGGTSQASLSN